MLDVCNMPIGRGAHPSIEQGACVMEMASYVAREKFSDNPKCVSPIIASFCRSWNDSLNDDDRNRLLRPFIFKVVGTTGTKKDENTRAWMVVDWLARVQTPAWLRLAGLTKEAEAIEACARIADAVTAKAAQPSLDVARERAAAAGNVARDAAGVAARVVARDVAWDAARVVARDVAGNVARDVARDAARVVARDVAWDAARVAARVVARDAARDVAWDVARDVARDAARDAAWVAAWNAALVAAKTYLRPTVEMLQLSACDLLDRMCAVGRAA